MIEVSAMQAREIRRAQRLREIEPDDFRAERRVERANVEVLLRVLSAKVSQRSGGSHADCLESAKALNLRAPAGADNEANPIRLSNSVIKTLLRQTGTRTALAAHVKKALHLQGLFAAQAQDHLRAHVQAQAHAPFRLRSPW
jgi:hypothetical protein